MGIDGPFVRSLFNERLREIQKKSSKGSKIYKVFGMKLRKNVLGRNVSLLFLFTSIIISVILGIHLFGMNGGQFELNETLYRNGF